MPRLALLAVSFLILAGCNEPNSQFCLNGAHPDDPMCKKGGPCTTNTDCTSMPGFPVCDTSAMSDTSGTCVLCTATDHTACTGMTPRCESHACVPCVDDNDCGAPGVGVCLPTGGCADPSNILHAISTGGSTMTTCGGMGAGNACTLDAALGFAKSGKNVIKLDDATPYSPNGNSFFVDSDVAIGLTIDARGAILHRNGNDSPILVINSNKAATVLGGTIEGALGNNGAGILCNAGATLAAHGVTIRMNEGFGINASGCGVTLSRSQILSNQGGGITIMNGKFVIIGNVFLGNGDINSTYGGVGINSGLDPMNRMEFNSISGNNAQVGGNAPGVHCTAGVGFIVRNNIIWGNNDNIGAQISGNCKHAYSDIGLISVASPNDSGNNYNMDPMFTSDLHLMPGSMAIKNADPNANLDGIAAKDIDGQPRIAPADIGADQLPRP